MVFGSDESAARSLDGNASRGLDTPSPWFVSAQQQLRHDGAYTPINTIAPDVIPDSIAAPPPLPSPLQLEVRDTASSGLFVGHGMSLMQVFYTASSGLFVGHGMSVIRVFYRTLVSL